LKRRLFTQRFEPNMLGTNKSLFMLKEESEQTNPTL